MKNKVTDCKLMSLSKIGDRSGNLTIISSSVDVPFNIKRIYYLYDIPSGESRGGHAHKNLYQLLVAASGSFDVLLDDGLEKRTVVLNRPDLGLLIVPGIWRELINFSSGATCLVLASLVYFEEDYIREYAEFLELKK
jgi:oxalate decarboxylase/phosphoglucose isomerase-like protein (cupin superfamily)